MGVESYLNRDFSDRFMDKVPLELAPLVEKYRELRIVPDDVTIFCHRVATRPTLGYEASLRAGQLDVTAAGISGLVEGLTRAHAGYRSGHIDEFLGCHQPRTTRRILWITGEVLPAPLRLLELGYNAFLCTCPLTDEQLEQYRVFDIAVGYACILTDQQQLRSPFHEEYRLAVECLLQQFSHYDFVLWPSQMSHHTFLQHPLAADLTQIEMMYEEVHLVERYLPRNCKVIYSLPDIPQEDIGRIPELANMIAGHIAFSPTSTLWDALRCQRDMMSPMPFVPVVDAGDRKGGKGLWPVLDLASLADCLNNMRDQGLQVLIAKTDHVPNDDGLLACRLWTIGHAAWGQSNPQRLAWTWSAAYRPDYSFSAHSDAFQRADAVAAALAHLASLQPKTARQTSVFPGYIDEVMAQIRQLEHAFPDTPPDRAQKRACLSDYFRYFCRDAWCLLHYHIDRLRLPSSGAATACQYEGGFWTSLSSLGGKAIPSGATVALLAKPRPLEREPAMHLIFQEWGGNSSSPLP